jgi:hypothetical protein
VALLVLLLSSGVLRSKCREALEVRRGEGVRRARLEGAAKQELRREQRGEIHIKCGARCLHVIMLRPTKSARVDRGDVPLRVTIGVAAHGRLVRVESAMRKPRAIAIHVRLSKRRL